MTYKKTLVDKRLVGKFKFMPIENGDHYRYKTLIGGLTITTKLSHGLKGDVDSWLESQISKQLRVSREDFYGMMDCPISIEQYHKKILEIAVSIRPAVGDEKSEKPGSKSKSSKRNKRR